MSCSSQLREMALRHERQGLASRPVVGLSVPELAPRLGVADELPVLKLAPEELGPPSQVKEHLPWWVASLEQMELGAASLAPPH